MNLRDEILKLRKQGYNELAAESRLCQEIVLKAISESGMTENATIKGGVVMQGITGDIRRATLDIDLDFIRYSISDESIRRFVDRLNCIDGVFIRIRGPVIELNHRDYKGKRIHITISDSIRNEYDLKMDIGVHRDLDIEQEEFSFDIGIQEDAVSLLINSKEQMIAEKLKSLMRFGTRSTRYKDIFDISYLIRYADKARLADCINRYIFEDLTLTINSMDQIVARIRKLADSTAFRRNVERSGKNWLDVPIDDVMNSLIHFFQVFDPPKRRTR